MMLNNTRLGLILLLVLALLIAACGDEASDDVESTSNDESAANADTADTTVTEETPLDLSSVNSDQAQAFADPFAPIVVMLPEQTIAAGSGALLINYEMPDGYKLNNLAPQQVALTVNGEAVVLPETWADYREVEPPLPLIVPLTLTEGQATITGELSIYWCEAVKEELCFIDNAELTIPVTVMAEADTSDITAAIPLTPPLQ